MRFSVARLLLLLLAFAIVVSVARWGDLNRRRQSPELFYGELLLIEPITGGFSYALDGGSITANLTDANGVSLNIVCSPPGGLRGDRSTKVYFGLRNEMWSQQATPIDRGSSEAKQIAGYIRATLQSVEVELSQLESDGVLDDQLAAKCLEEQTKIANRVIKVLTTTNPLREEWGLDLTK